MEKKTPPYESSRADVTRNIRTTNYEHRKDLSRLETEQQIQTSPYGNLLYAV